MDSNDTDQGLLLAGAATDDTTMGTGVAIVKLVRAPDAEKLYLSQIDLNSPALPPEMDVREREDLSISGRVVNQAQCNAVFGSFIANKDSVSLWKTAFNDLPGTTSALATQIEFAEDAPRPLSGSPPEQPPAYAPPAYPPSPALAPPIPSPAPAPAPAPAPQVSELVQPTVEAQTASTPAEQQTSYSSPVTIDDVEKGTEIIKNVAEAWRAFFGPSDDSGD